MTSREMFENAHIEKFGWYSGIQLVDGKYYPAAVGGLPYIAEALNKRYEMFTAGLHSRDELLREASAIVMELLTDYCEGGYDEKIIVDTEKYIDKLQSALKEAGDVQPKK